ncbi:hypothetical protein N0V82_005167 [Gnomoniopsis sp. IMI 355080]|nr:hypothetical protein N0V82_005167 [Gnomoniopsis sp. IMI 355080]
MAPNKQKTALITGCSEGGIGHALALEFSRRGVHVFATARTPSKMASLETIPNITLLAMDVTSQASIDSAAKAVINADIGAGETLDYLVNNAGGQVVMPVLDLDMNVARQMYEVNFWGMLAVIKTFAPLVIKAKGTIANLSSIGASLYIPYLVTYASSKAAGEVLSEGLRRELAPFGVRVATVIVGGVKTNIHQNSPQHQLPPGSLYTPVAEKISDRATGKDINVRMDDPHVFAKRLVKDLLDGASGKIYRGNISSTMGFLAWFLPSWVMDRFAVMGTGLDSLW